MNFVKNANQIISKELHKKSTAAYYKSLVDAVNNKYQTRFVSDMQIYVTRIGIIVSSVVEGRHITYNTYLGSIDYLCNVVLKNKNLYSILRAIEINTEGNLGKHSIKNISADIEECVRQYNRLIKGLIDVGLTEFSISYLKLNAKEYRDKEIFIEKYEEKFGTLAGTKFKVELSKNTKLDPYDKTITTQLIISWPNSHSKRKFNIDLFVKNRTVGKKDNIVLANPGKQNFTIRVKERDLDRRKLTVKAKLSLVEDRESTYETGFLFWKKQHTYTSEVNVATTEVIVSIIL